MSYTVNKSDGTGIELVDTQIDTTSTSVALVGRNAPGYGELVMENTVHMLESFAAEDPPANPIVGQLWYKKDTNNALSGKLHVYDLGTNGEVNPVWKPIGMTDIHTYWTLTRYVKRD